MDIERIKSTLATGGEHLGDMVFWSLADARIDRIALESLWSQAGLSEDLLPDAPTAEKALKLAVREAHVGNTDCLIRLAKEDADEIVFAIVHEQRTGDGDLDYRTEARISLDRRREVFSSDRPGHDLVTGVKSRFDLYRATHHPDDVRRTIVKALHSFAAVTLREGGGVYWVPAPFAEKLRRLQSAVEQIGTSRVYLLPVHRSRDSEQTLGEIARGSVEQELDDLKREIAEFTSTPPERASTLTRRLEAFDGLRARARLYRDVLHVQVQDLDQQLGQLSRVVERLLTQKSAA
jgi:hypothetical protein